MTDLATATYEGISEAYYRLSGRKANVRVRLADLRKALRGLSRKELDGYLTDMQRMGLCTLYPLENPRERTAADKEAAYYANGFPRHIIYLGGTAS